MRLNAEFTGIFAIENIIQILIEILKSRWLVIIWVNTATIMINSINKC